MSDNLAPPSVADLMQQLLAQNASGFAEIRQSQALLTTTVSKLDKDVALVQQTMDTLKDLPNRVGQLEIKREVQQGTMEDLERRVSANTKHIGDLLTDSNKLKGWGGPAGKIFIGAASGLLVVLLGAVFALATSRPARAVDMRLDNVANQKCWAAPAKAAPKHLYL